MTSGSDGASPPGVQPHTAKVIAVVAVVVAVLVVSVALLSDRSSQGETSPGAASSLATTAPAAFVPPADGCPSLVEQSGVDAPLRAGTSAPPVGLVVASYLVDKSTKPARVSHAGQLTGMIPVGSHVWVLSYPRKDTFDSTPEHNPGNGRIYPIGEVKTANGCWTLPPRALGYAEALGITYDQYVVLVDDTAAQEFADESVKQRRDGFSLEEFALRDATTIATFPILTSP